MAFDAEGWARDFLKKVETYPTQMMTVDSIAAWFKSAIQAYALDCEAAQPHPETPQGEDWAPKAGECVICDAPLRDGAVVRDDVDAFGICRECVLKQSAWFGPSQPHPETLRAYVQHKPDCRSRSLRDFCRQHGGDGGINGCPACQGMAPSRSCTCGLNEALEALSYACQAADCRDCDSDYCECRCHKHAAQTKALRALSQKLRARAKLFRERKMTLAERSGIGFYEDQAIAYGISLAVEAIDALSASPAPHTEKKPTHVCGLTGYNGMIDPPCPGCAAERTE